MLQHIQSGGLLIHLSPLSRGEVCAIAFGSVRARFITFLCLGHFLLRKTERFSVIALSRFGETDGSSRTRWQGLEAKPHRPRWLRFLPRRYPDRLGSFRCRLSDFARLAPVRHR